MDVAVLVALVLARFVAPLFIPAFPLPALLTCLVLDGVDRDVLTAFTRLDLSGYQGTDKALDVFYLTVAMLSVLRNWRHRTAVRAARFLFYFRLVGVTAFELSGWRPFLLLFANTFEYFFVFYEVVRSRWCPERLSPRFHITAVAVIWVVVKLPQEYWLHVAQLETTDLAKKHLFGVSATTSWADAVATRPGAVVVLLVAAVVVLLGLRAVARAVVPPPEHALVLAAAPLPQDIDEAWERDRFVTSHWRVVDWHLAEKVVLVSLVSVVFAQVVPRVDATPLQLTVGVAVVVSFNSVLTMRAARAGRGPESGFKAFALLAATNAVFVLVADLLLRRDPGDLDPRTTLFFLLLLSLIVTLYDRFRPVHDARFSAPV